MSGIEMLGHRFNHNTHRAVGLEPLQRQAPGGAIFGRSGNHQGANPGNLEAQHRTSLPPGINLFGRLVQVPNDRCALGWWQRMAGGEQRNHLRLGQRNRWRLMGLGMSQTQRVRFQHAVLFGERKLAP